MRCALQELTGQRHCEMIAAAEQQEPRSPYCCMMSATDLVPMRWNTLSGRRFSSQELSLMLIKELNQQFDEEAAQIAIDYIHESISQKFLHQLVSGRWMLTGWIISHVMVSCFTGVSEGTIAYDRILKCPTGHTAWQADGGRKGIYSIEKFLVAADSCAPAGLPAWKLWWAPNRIDWSLCIIEASLLKARVPGTFEQFYPTQPVEQDLHWINSAG